MPLFPRKEAAIKTETSKDCLQQEAERSHPKDAWGGNVGVGFSEKYKGLEQGKLVAAGKGGVLIRLSTKAFLPMQRKITCEAPSVPPPPIPPPLELHTNP